MFHDAYHLIEPLPKLADHLHRLSRPDFTKVLSRPVVVRNREGERLGKQANEGSVKVLFLRCLFGLFESDPSYFEQGSVKLFGSDRIGIDLFDRWWTIVPLDPSDPTHAPLLGVAQPGEFDRENIPLVDHWIKRSDERDGPAVAAD